MTDEEFTDLMYNIIYLARRVGRNEDNDYIDWREQEEDRKKLETLRLKAITEFTTRI